MADWLTACLERCGERCSRTLWPVLPRLSRVAAMASLASLTGLAGCTRTSPPVTPPAPVHQTLLVAAFPDYFGPQTLPSFSAKTGHRIELEVFSTNERLLANLDARPYDVVFLSGYAVEHLIERGRVARMLREHVPNLVQVPPMFRNPPQDPGLVHCIPYVWWVVGLSYLPPKIGHVHEPQSLDAVFSAQGPEAVWLDDMRATLGMALRKLGRSANTREPTDLAAAQHLLFAAAHRGVRLIDDPSELANRGTSFVGLAWSNDVFALFRKTPELRFLIPKEGTLLYIDFACVLAQTKQAEAAFLFLNHLLEPGVSAEIANTQLLPTVSESGYKLLDSEARWPWGVLESLRGHSGSYEPLRDVGDATLLYEKTWAQVLDKIKAENARLEAQAAVRPRAPKKPKKQN